MSCLDILIMNNKPTKEDVKEKALRVLGFRSHSEYELREKLCQFGGDEEDINFAVEFCKEYGFLNDESYAKDLARDLNNLKKYGKHRIKAELLKRGINSEYVEAAHFEVEDNSEVLMSLVSKKLKGCCENHNSLCFLSVLYL